jgi:hypothetical protein
MGYQTRPYSTTGDVVTVRRPSTTLQEVMTVNIHRPCKIMCQITNNYHVTCSM